MNALTEVIVNFAQLVEQYIKYAFRVQTLTTTKKKKKCTNKKSNEKNQVYTKNK